MLMKKSLLAVSIAAATGLGVSQNALADSYAYAYNNIFELVITASGGIQPLSSVFDLSNRASLTGFAGQTNAEQFTSGTAPFDINDSNIGIADSNSPAKNGNIGTNYARGDASILTSELEPGAPPAVTGDPTDTWAVAESYLVSKASGSAAGTTGSTSTFEFFVADPGTTISFTFEAVMELIACVDQGGSTCAITPGIFATNARAVSAVSFVITDADGNTVFDWAPGTAPTIGNGGASLNPWSLNTNVGRDQTNKGVATENLNTAGADYFFAQTVALGTGLHTLTLADTKNVTTNLNVAAPEPETLALMGIGLLGMFAAARRKQA